MKFRFSLPVVESAPSPKPRRSFFFRLAAAIGVASHPTLAPGALGQSPKKAEQQQAPTLRKDPKLLDSRLRESQTQTIKMFRTVEITAALQDPYPTHNGYYWAPPGQVPKSYALGVGVGVKVAWWVPVSSFSALANFTLIGIDVKPDDIYLVLLGVDAPSHLATLNIQIFLAK